VTDSTIGSAHRLTPRGGGRYFRFPPDRRSLVERWPGVVVAILAALGVAALVVAAVYAHDWWHHHEVTDPSAVRGDYVTLLSDPTGSGLPAELTPVWTPAPAEDAKLPETVRAVRIGARMADLEIAAYARNRRASYGPLDSAAGAVVHRNSALVAAFAAELAASLDSVPDGARAAALYRFIQGRGEREATVSLQDRARRASLGFHPRLLALGNWLETARIAALRGDRVFLTSPECRAEAEEAVSLPGLSRDARSALERVRGLIVAGAIGDLDALEQALTDALRATAN
jgi:hypothetical protein